MTRQQITCQCCKVPFTRTIAGPVPSVWYSRYYDAAKADWCAECRLGVCWFESESLLKLVAIWAVVGENKRSDEGAINTSPPLTTPCCKGQRRHG